MTDDGFSFVGLAARRSDGVSRDQLRAQPDGKDADQGAERGVEGGPFEIVALEEVERVEAEGGEGREAAEDAGEKEQPSVRAERVVLYYHAGQDSGCQATDDVDDEGAERESERRRVMENEAPQLVPRHGADKSAKSD